MLNSKYLLKLCPIGKYLFSLNRYSIYLKKLFKLLNTADLIHFYKKLFLKLPTCFYVFTDRISQGILFLYIMLILKFDHLFLVNCISHVSWQTWHSLGLYFFYVDNFHEFKKVLFNGTFLSVVCNLGYFVFFMKNKCYL